MTFVFVFRPKIKFHFRRHFPLRPKVKSAFSVGLYIKLFQITPYLNDFQTFNNPVSGQPVGALKISFTLHFWHKSHILHHHRRRRRRRVVRVNRCAGPWPLVISDLHSIDSSMGVGILWTLLSHADVARATRRSSPADNWLSAFVCIHHQTQSIMYYSRVQACNMAKQR